jgi:hypothetical protein
MPFETETKHGYNNIRQYKILSCYVARYFRSYGQNDLSRNRNTFDNINSKPFQQPEDVRKKITGHPLEVVLKDIRARLKSTLIAGRKS